MNKFNIDDLVFYIVSSYGEIRLEMMKIVEISKDRHGIYYTGIPQIIFNGVLQDDTEESKQTWREKMLFPSDVDALNNLKFQIDLLEANRE